MLNDRLLAKAYQYLGLKEAEGKKNNPEVLALYAKTKKPQMEDSVPWCAAFVNAVLFDCGIPGTESLAAISFAKFGKPVAHGDEKPGDIVFLGQNNTWKGHVGFLIEYKHGKCIKILGGNQDDSVSIKNFYPGSYENIFVRRAKDPSFSRKPAAISSFSAGYLGAITPLLDAVSHLSGTAQAIIAIAISCFFLGILIIFRKKIREVIYGN